ncbi:MAG: ABC transporter permease, partial [Pararhodobacter sp.]
MLERLLRRPGGLAGLILLALMGALALTASLLFPGDPLAIAGRPMLAPFTDAGLPLGTDRLGRDLLAGLVHGARTSLTVGIAAALTALTLGVVVGTLAGFAGGRIDEALMRLVEAFQ